MKTSLIWIGLILLIAVVGGLVYWLKPAPQAPVVVSAPSRPPQALPPIVVAEAPPAPAIPDNIGVGSTDSPILPIPDPLLFPPVDAAATMANAREHGDARMPPLDQVKDQREPPTPEELADPKAYQRYEARQNARLYKAYVAAADEKIPELQADIDRARKAGFSKEQLKEVEEKVRRIQEMKDQLKAQHPELYQQ